MSEMMGSEKGEASAIIAARVGAAREVQMARQNRSMHILAAALGGLWFRLSPASKRMSIACGLKETHFLLPCIACVLNSWIVRKPVQQKDYLIGKQ